MLRAVLRRKQLLGSGGGLSANLLVGMREVFCLVQSLSERRGQVISLSEDRMGEMDASRVNGAALPLVVGEVCVDVGLVN
jgi:hypothetical protein